MSQEEANKLCITLGIVTRIYSLILMHTKSVNEIQAGMIIETIRNYFDGNKVPADELAYKLTDDMATLNDMDISVDEICYRLGEYANKAELDVNERFDIVVDALALGMVSNHQDERFGSFIGALRHNIGITNEMASGDFIMDSAQLKMRTNGLNVDLFDKLSAREVIQSALSRTDFNFY